MKNKSFDDSLFPKNLPEVSTDKQLQQAIKLYQNYDSYFIASGCIKERKEKFHKLWQNFKPYADRHFKKQVEKNFHQRTWEMYLCNVFLEKNLEIESKDEGPDFVINKKIYCECVAPTKGEAGKIDSVPEMIFALSPEQMVAQDVPVDKMILRITNSINFKALVQYERWKNKPWFSEKSSFIIAINTGELGFPQDYLGIPLIIKALFGLLYLQISRSGTKSFSYRQVIEKGGGVPVNYFADDKYSFISGVIFSQKTVLNHPKIIGEDCIFINNP